MSLIFLIDLDIYKCREGFLSFLKVECLCGYSVFCDVEGKECFCFFNLVMGNFFSCS